MERNSKMKKRVSKKTKKGGTVRKAAKTSKTEQAGEYIGNLVQLHKVQGALLGRLDKLLR